MVSRAASPPLPCVWMSAGLVSFKLCDREGECEGCPFDRAMRGLALTSEPGIPAAEPLSTPWMFPADRGYHRGHGWAMPVAAGRLRVGVDALVVRLWSRVSGVILPALGSHLAAGETACWLEDGAELLPLASPVAGTVVARNGGILTEPALVAVSPYEAGWLFEAEAGTAGEPLAGAAAARARSEAALDAFRRAAVKALGAGRAEVGPTLQDGGEPLADLRAMLGPSRYAGLVRRHLSIGTGRRRASRP